MPLLSQVLNVLESSIESGVEEEIPNEVRLYSLTTYTHIHICTSIIFTMVQDLVEVFNNILNETNELGWQTLQTIDSGSQSLLRNAERYGAYLAGAVNTTEEPVILVRENIGECVFTL